jgi:regulator of protease activity HflC (stomatin/prohibitin superfamily)
VKKRLFREASEEPESATPRFGVVGPWLAHLRGKLLRLGCLLTVAIAPILLVRGCMLTYVPPDEIGLRQIAYGSGRGLQKEVVGSGYRREVLGYETIRTLPRDIQIVEFTDDQGEGGAHHRLQAAINCPTVDGYPVKIDVTVLYRIADPHAVVSRFGFGHGYEDSVVIRFTDPLVKHHLGELRAEEFYGDRRLHKVQTLKRELARRFAENGLALEDVLVRQYDYPDTFQQLTEQKKIQDQSVLTNISLRKQAEVQTRLNEVRADGQNLISIKTAEFQAQITEVDAQRDLYERQRRAEADLLVKTAEASGTELINRAMEGPGSDKLLRLRKGLAVLNAIKGPIYIAGDPTDLSADN